MRRPLLEPLLMWLAERQLRRPWVVVLLVLLSLIPAGFATSRLELKTGFSELLPDSKPSVVEMRRVNRRLAGTSTLTVVAQGKDAESLKRFVDEVAPRLRELPPDLVAGVDDGTRATRAFFEKYKYLYADLADIEQLHDDVIARYDYEVGKKTGFDLELDEDDDAAPAPITAESLEKRFAKKVAEAKRATPGVDGYYIGEGGHLAAILVRTPLGSGDPKAFELKEKIREIVAKVAPERWDPSLEVEFTGNLVTSAEEHAAVTGDLAHVGMWGVGLILGIVFLYFLRFRTLITMSLTILTGCLWSFGVAKLTVGYLNMATGFLVSIIAGNGINFSIIFMARYIEARRDEKLDVAESIRTSHRDTHTATLAAAGAAMIAYGSLAATDFRGFKHFGIIGGAGMLLCWLATYSLLPAILVITERMSPMYGETLSWRARLRGIYGYPFALLARKFPRVIAVVGLALGAASVVLAVRYFAHDPMEYDLANVRNERLSPTAAGTLSVRVDKFVGRLGQDGRAILVDDLADVKPLVTELERRRDAAPKQEKPFSRVVSIYDLLPQDQARKIELLTELKARITRAHERGFISDADWKKLAPEIPERLTALGIADLPEQVARAFEEKDGTRGRIVYIVPTEGRSVYDAHYLLAWADSFREVKLPNGHLIRGSGDPVIFADMLINVSEDAPKAVGFSLVGTLLIVLLAFRGRPSGWAALGTLLLGIAWLVAFLALRDIKLNFLNFVALPISIGVGADYAVNVMKRRDIEGDAQLYRVFVETGGAVVLCSLTTVLGYIALTLSINRAVHSFGLAAAVGELTTLLAAMLVLPALLFWRARRHRVRILTLPDGVVPDSFRRKNR
ncbi:MAG: MMPL family transporter [Sorangiineae bacterium]|nr:MMPL family transporter [Polyangiaceae bacterium]MEB2322347.1 MMPL family transporter [Sorangiineae bacterium]